MIKVQRRSEKANSAKGWDGSNVLVCDKSSDDSPDTQRNGSAYWKAAYCMCAAGRWLASCVGSPPEASPLWSAGDATELGLFKNVGTWHSLLFGKKLAALRSC
jgi:hypothetical protein